MQNLPEYEKSQPKPVPSEMRCNGFRHSSQIKQASRTKRQMRLTLEWSPTEK
jgi:hypothetical protein